jgi:hypothetical protein
MPTGQYPRPALPERFDKKWKLDAATGCWLWTAAKVRRTANYEQPIIGTWRSRTENAHRIAWLLHRGPIPDGQYVLHRCDNPLCVNPEHLFLGTHQDNMDDMILKARNSSKLTAAEIPTIRRRYDAGERPVDLAAEYGVSPTLIVHIGKRKGWRHIP